MSQHHTRINFHDYPLAPGEQRSLKSLVLQWWVTCECGYTSKMYDKRRDAERDELEHAHQINHAEP